MGPRERRASFPPPALALFGVALAASGWPAPGAAQGAAGPREGGDAVRAARRTGPVEIDGRIEEAAWSRAEPARDFVQARPDEGAPAARPTEVRVLFDDRALWFAFRMHDDPGAIRHQLVRRDGEGAFDLVRVELDPDGDDRTGYLFRVSAAGAERDAFLHDDVRVDESWDAVWASAVHRDAAGWGAEMRIPLSEIDFVAADTARTWGVNVVRRRLASDSRSMLFLRSRTRSGRVSQFGRLEGIRVREGGGTLQLEPYATARVRAGPAQPSNPFTDGTSVEPRVGLDARWSPASNLTLDATVNPGFGQVEVDPAVVNLTAFETFFPEKRPFFTQDARIFDFPLSGPSRVLFHSRRVGREPRGEPPAGAGAVEAPDATSILGAAKLTGRTPGGTSVGVMGAVTARETGRAFFPGEGTIRPFTAQPRAGHGVARVEQDLRGGATRVGAVVAGVHRELPASGAFDHLARTAVAGGLDFEHRWGGDRHRRYALWGYVAGSRVAGPREAMTSIQRDENHYFQRPDAAYKSVDSTATALAGREWRLQVERRSAEHWTWAAWVNEVSPGFVIDDVGFAGATLPRIDVGGQLRYQDITPGSLFRSWSVRLNTFHNFRHSLLDAPLDPGAWSSSHEGGSFLLDGDFELHGGWEAGLAATWEPATLTERETRGGPLMADPATVGLTGRMGTDPRDGVNVGLTVGVEESGRAGSALDATLDLELRPSPGWEIRAGPSYARRDDRAQFVTSTDALPHAPTFGRRYLFADVLREELGMEARLDVALTPDLSLQVFAQPLLSSADFRAYKQLERPRSFDFRRFGEGEAVVADGGAVGCRGGRTCVADGTRHVDLDGDGLSDQAFPDRDFTLASLRGNAVLRWEYLSGSELFLVWQQRRRGRAPVGPLDVGAGLERMLSADPRDTFLLKVRHHVRF